LGPGAGSLSGGTDVEKFLRYFEPKGVEVTTSRFLAAVAAAALSTATGAAGAPVVPSSSDAGAAWAKKRCHFVKKKVHGKLKRVRVCTKAKPKPKPKNVSVAVEGSNLRAATIGNAGGSVSARAGSGALLTLTIPAGALDGSTQVSLTPVASVRGLPKAIKFRSGAQFAPEGLALAKPATLTIDGGPSGSRASALAWFGNGRDAHRYPVRRTASGLEITVAHFSGVGAVDGPSSLLPSARTALTIEFARYVRPLLRRAETDDGVLEEAFGRAFAWEHAAAVVGLLDEFPSFRRELRRSFEKALANAMERASERCANHDLTQLARILRIQRLADLADIEFPGASALERADRCARFELDLDFAGSSHRTADLDGMHSEEQTALHVEARKVHVGIAESFLEMSGEGPLAVLDWQYREDAPTCAVRGLPASPKAPVRARLRIGSRAQGQPEFVLTLDPGDVDTPEGAGCFREAWSPPFYGFYWDHLYPGEKSAEGRYILTLQQAGALIRFGPDKRELHLQDQYGPLTVASTLTLVLRHVPLR